MRQKIDFGIDLGTTNSAIAYMQDGEAVIVKSDDKSLLKSKQVFISKTP